MVQGKTKVLLVEDNPGDARLIQEMLTGFKLECQEQLSSGLKYLSKGKADVVLLDLTLPDSQGVDTFIEIGPGRVLTGLIRRIDKDARTINISDLASIKGLISAE